MFSRHKVSALVLAGGCLLLAAGAAVADPTASADATKPAPTAAGATVANASLPKGYVAVSSGPIDAPNATKTRGVVSCPAGLVPLGGGAFVDSASTFVAISGSFPSNDRWAADIINTSGQATTFEVRAICAQRPRAYRQVVGTAVANPQDQQTEAFVTCPTGSKPLGGGGVSTLGAIMNSSLPSGNGWRVDENNFFGGDGAVVVAVAVCGKVKGYSVAAGPVTTTPAGSQTISRAFCPPNARPIGGGVLSLSPSLEVNLNTTYPAGVEWDSYINNRTASDVTEVPIAVCAAATA